jgi:hypothetical protein
MIKNITENNTQKREKTTCQNIENKAERSKKKLHKGNKSRKKKKMKN